MSVRSELAKIADMVTDNFELQSHFASKINEVVQQFEKEGNITWNIVDVLMAVTGINKDIIVDFIQNEQCDENDDGYDEREKCVDVSKYLVNHFGMDEIAVALFLSTRFRTDNLHHPCYVTVSELTKGAQQNRVNVCEITTADNKKKSFRVTMLQTQRGGQKATVQLLNPNWRPQDRDLILYHATSDESAYDICFTKPAICGRGASDFNRGFYLTNNFATAVEWAKRKIPECSATPQAAVLMFRLRRELWANEILLDLCNNLCMWEKVVRENREQGNDVNNRDNWSEFGCQGNPSVIIGPIALFDPPLYSRNTRINMDNTKITHLEVSTSKYGVFVKPLQYCVRLNSALDKLWPECLVGIIVVPK